tara:strand:+ start:133 stop:609 length:477 start_codon:yes stop_codon:yes gene_type:complete
MTLERKFKIFYSLIILLSLSSICYAFFVEYILGYKPCILCKYQRLPYILTLIIGLIGFVKPSNKRVIFFIFLTFLISMTLSGYHVGIEQELYQSIFNCSDNNLSILEEGKLLESLNVINPDCRNVNFAIFGVSLATINFVLSFVISSVSYYLYSYAKN